MTPALYQKTLEDPDFVLAEVLSKGVSVVIRRRWYVIAPLFLVTLVGIGVVFFVLPPRYEAEAVLRVVQPQIAQRYVDPAFTKNTADVVNSVTGDVLSRTNLLSLVKDFNLYPDDRDKVPPDVLAERMRKNITVDIRAPLVSRTEPTSFVISFSGDSPRLAVDVTNRLAYFFVQGQMKEQEVKATATTAFLEDRLDIAKQRLSTQDAKIRAFRIKFSTVLSNQSQASVSASDPRMRLHTWTADMGRLQQQRTSLEALLNGKLAGQQSQEAKLLSQYTPVHPEVRQNKTDLAFTRALLAHLKGAGEIDQADNSTPVSDPMLAQLEVQVQAVMADIAALAAEEPQLRDDVEKQQRQLSVAPIREQELAGLLREYELYKQDYSDLVSKQLHAQLTTSMEERKGSLHFSIIDLPLTPTAPSSPNRLKGSMISVGLGLILGLAFALAVDAGDKSHHTEESLMGAVAAPIVIGIPILHTPEEERRAGRRSAIEWWFAGALFLILSAAAVYVYQHR